MAAQPQRLQRPQARMGRLHVSVATRVKVSIPQVIEGSDADHLCLVGLGACVLQKEIGDIPSTQFVLRQGWKCNPFRTEPELFFLSRSLREFLSYFPAMSESVAFARALSTVRVMLL